MRDAPARVLFLNSGILGHRTVGALFREVAALLRRLDAVHTDLSADLKLTDRVARRLLSLRFGRARPGDADAHRFGGAARRMGAAAIARVAPATTAAYAARLRQLVAKALERDDVYAA